MDFSDIVEQPGQPKPYWQTLDEYRRARASDPTIAQMSLPQYASGINQIVGQPEHQENIQDSALRHAGANIDIAMHHFGGAQPGTWPQGWPTLSQVMGGPREGVDLPGMAKSGAEKLAGQMGAGPGVAGAVGKGAEQLTESLPAAVAGTALGIPGLAAVSGLQTYGETGSKLQAGISATGAALIPKFMEGAGQAVLGRLGAKTLGELRPEQAALLPKGAPELNRFMPSGLVQRGAEFGAKQAGLTANMLATGAAETVADPNQTWADKLKSIGSEFSPSNLIATGIGQLPFTAMDAVSARVHPLDLAVKENEANFSNRFSKAYQETAGKPPTTEEVDSTIQRLKTGEKIPADSTTGKVLQSIGQAPMQMEIKDLHTSQGTWNGMEAVEATRNKANDMLVAQGLADPARPPITSAHDQLVATVLRGIDSKTLTKDDTAHLAASKITDSWAGDLNALRQSGYNPEADFPPFGQGTDPQKRFINYQNQAGVEERIAALIDPNSKYYDQTTDQKMALVAGDQEHWRNAGIPEGLTQQIGKAIDEGTKIEAPEGVTPTPAGTPLLTNIINRVSGLGPKRAEREAAIQRAISEYIAQHGIFDVQNGEGVLHDRLQMLYGQLQRIRASKWERGGMVKGNQENAGAPLGDATFAARRAALLYDKPFDINDPRSVADFVRYISKTIRQAEDNYSRQRLTQPTLKGPDGKSLRFPTQELAQEHADDLNSKLTGRDQFNVNYTVPGVQEPDGTWRVLENHYASLFGHDEAAMEAERLAEAGKADLAERLKRTKEQDESTEALVKEVNSQVTLDKLANEFFQERVAEVSKHNDPAVVEGRLQAMSRNFSDVMQVVSDADLSKLWKDKFGTKPRDLDLWKKRFIRYVQFLAYHGDVSIQQNGDRLEGVGDLAELNKFMAELGYGKYPAGHERAGEEYADVWNRRQRGAPNFFERFALVSNHIQRYMVNPKTMLPDPEHRPLGDFGWMGPEFRRDLDKKVTVNWPEDTKQSVKDFTHIQPGVKNRDGSEYRSDLAGIGSKTGMIKNQTGHLLADVIIQSTKHDLVMKAKDVAKWFKRFGGVDTTLAEELFKKLPFVANQNVGFSVTKDPLNRGYFHSNDLTSAGVLVDPFVHDVQTGKLQLQQPHEIFQTLVEELGHSAVDFAYNNDQGFKLDVDRAYEHVKGRLDDLVKIGGEGKFAQLGLTSLRNAQEMLAGMFRDPGLHEFLKGIDDPEAVFGVRTPPNMFMKLYNMIRDLFTKHVGPLYANTMLDRVTNLTTRAIGIQQGMKLVNRGDIYQELYNRGLLSMQGQPVPKPQETVPVFPPPQRELTGQVAALQRQLDEAKELLGGAMQYPDRNHEFIARYVQRIQGLEQQLAEVQVEGPTKSTTYVKPERAGKLPKDIKPVKEMLLNDVEQARMNLSLARRDPDTYAGDVKHAEEVLRQAFDRVEAYDRGELGVQEVVNSSAVKDMESKLADLKAQLEATNNLHIAATNEVEVQQRVTSERLAGAIKSTEALLGQLRQIAQLGEGETLSSGSVLESRATGKTYIDDDGIERFERIVRPAVRTQDGKLYVGYIHADAQLLAKGKPTIDGFVTDTGRFITRDEAEIMSGGRMAEDLPELENAPPLTEQEELGKTSWTPEQMKSSILESRTDPSRVVDAMKAASVYLTEDNQGDLWFKPFNVERFRNVFGPAFGAKLRLTENGGQWGYSIRPSEAFNLTPQDVARMPMPVTKPWAPSIFETMKSLFKQQGASDQTAEALAGYNMQFASLLRSSENITWGELPSMGEGDNLVLGQAWGYWKHAGITPEGASGEYAPPENFIRHESAHASGVNGMFNREPNDVKMAMRQVNAMFEGLTEEQRKALMVSLVNTTNFEWNTKGGLTEGSLTQPWEFAAEVMGHVGDAIVQIPKASAYLREMMKFVPDEISKMIQTATLRRTQGLDRLGYLMENVARSRGVDADMMGVLKDVTNVFKEMSRSALDIAEDQSEFYRTRLVYPDTYKSLLKQIADSQEQFEREGKDEVTPKLSGEVLESRMPPPIENMIRKFFNYPTSDGVLPTKLSLWDKNLMQFPQFAMKYPSARSFFDMFLHSDVMRKVFRLQGQVALAGAYEGNKVLDDVRTKQVAQFYKSPTMRNKLSKIALEMDVLGDHRYDQAKEEAGGDELRMDPTTVTSWLTPQYQRTLMDKHGVTDAERPIIQTVLDGLRNQYTHVNKAIVGAHFHAMETQIASGVARNTDMLPEAARGTAKLLTKAVQTASADPVGAAELLAQFRLAVKNDDVATRMETMAQEGWQDILRLERSFAMRAPYYFSEMRPGKFGLVWKDAQGKTVNRYFVSDKERADYVTRNNIKPERTTNPGSGLGINPNMMGLIDEVHQQTVERTRNLFGDEEADRIGKTVDFSTDLRDALNRNDLLRETLGRKLQPGRDELDMFDTTQHYLNSVSNAIMSRFIRREAELLFTSPEFNNEPEIKAHIQSQIEAMMKPDTPTGSLMRNLGFFYYLWGNASSMIMQTSHQVMGLAPMLTRLGQSVAGSFNTIYKANQAVIAAKRGGYKDPIIRDMVNRLRADVEVQSWISRETDYNKDLSLINRIRGTSGKPLWEPFDMLKNKLFQGFDLVRKMYDVVPTYNSEVAFVAAVMHLKSEAGGALRGDELYKEAQFLRSNTMYTGGKANRPGFFQWMPRSAAQGLWSLQTYANGLTTEMGELIRRSFNPKGMTPAQTKQVRKAAAQMLITQTAVSGVLGLPFATIALTALQKLFPDMNVEGEIREALAHLAGDDDAMGSFFSNAAVMGIPSAMDYSPDLGSRFALHGVFHVSPYGDVGWEQLMGPAGGIATNVLKGAQAGLEGRPLETVQSLMPVGFRRIWQALEQGQTYKTQSGRIMVNDLGPEEVVARMIGFRPARVRRIEDAERLNKVSEDAEKEEQQAWTKKQVNLMKENRDPEVRQNIASRVADKKGIYPARKLADDVAQEYEKQSNPVDTRNFGNRATVLAQKSLQGVLGTQTEGPSNVDRLQLQSQIAQRLGLGGPSPARWRRAAGVDQLLQMYPHLTTPQAGLLLNHAAASRPTPDLYSELLTSGE